jgi:hypothetical protein
LCDREKLFYSDQSRCDGQGERIVEGCGGLRDLRVFAFTKVKELSSFHDFQHGMVSKLGIKKPLGYEAGRL